MSEYIVQSSSLTAVANKIREKTGGSAPLEFPDEFIAEIGSMIHIPETPTDSILFYSPDPFSVGITNRSKNWDGAIYYSTNRQTWTEWDGSDIMAVRKGSTYVIYFKGDNVSYFNTQAIADQGAFNVIGGCVKCVGNLKTLIDKDMGGYIYPNYFCSYMFYNCFCLDFDLIISFDRPGLYGYFHMFENCKSLTKAPALATMNLASGVYMNMFKGCSALLSPPELPATTIAKSCYEAMFEECVNLRYAPELPALTAEQSCYAQMFKGCTSLTTPPALPAQTLDTACYNNMFRECIALTSAPVLSATTLASSCYSYMFYGCTSLQTPPALPATTLNSSCYASMFQGCTALTTVPALPATALESQCYYGMFMGCTNLETINELPATVYKTNCYREMYRGCSKIKLSTTQTGEYQTEYRLPSSGTGTALSGAFLNMFTGTGGTFATTPEVNTTYYTPNTVISAA